ncbi:predicted protein [Naegleria gruberi]|uniref:Predicted protein n=1 Tax=Naegleria gruberi TaxID=5762 RepID=D2V108_NAEGR|nr:uncharacterized protein NAEGRDRAFT_62483 [Naegleria gruberi]EFC49822.1 predicted protein [Naegleria gruberi]|eukprot:XP_002682566.1 predicted protein [Naegleria gruberi strain NEG-M]
MSKQKNTKSSTQWFDNAQVSILEEVIRQNDGKPFTIQETETAHEQMKLLSTSADTKGIKFSSTALHYQYYHSKFKKRALLMYNVLSGLWRVESVTALRKKQEYNEKTILDKFNKLVNDKKKSKKEYNASEFSELMTYSLVLSSSCNELIVDKTADEEDVYHDEYYTNEEVSTNTHKQQPVIIPREFTIEKIDLKKRFLRVASIGGGPGNDSAAFVVLRESMLNKIFEKGSEISCDLYDLEKNWKNYLPRLQELTKDSLRLDFNRCDVTKGLENSLNRALKDRVQHYDIFLFSYVCNETSHLTKQADGIFFRELFTNAKPYSMFVFTDVIEYAKKALLYVESVAKSVGDNFISFHPQSNQAQVMAIIKY